MTATDFLLNYSKRTTVEEMRSGARCIQLILKIVFQLEEKFNGGHMYCCLRMLFKILN